MAIIIPSKYIFGDPTNEKVRKNVIKTVNVETSIYSMDSRDNEQIYQSTFVAENVAIDGTEKESTKTVYLEGNTYVLYYTVAKPKYSSFEFRIPKFPSGTTILGTGSDSIQYELLCDVETRDFTAKVEHVAHYSPTITDKQYGDVTYTQEKIDYISNEVENGKFVLSLADLTSVIIEETGDAFIFSVSNLITSIETTKAKTKEVLSPGASPNFDGYDLNGTNQKYTAKSVSITVNGQKIVWNIDTKNVQVGDGSNQYSLDGSELLQNGTMILGSVASDYIGRAIYEQYKQGKETIELDCAIADYYRENGEKAISIDGSLPMVFENGDTVIPQKRVGSRDVPYSTYKNGKPKKFMVVSANVYYDGVTMQKLYLLET